VAWIQSIFSFQRSSDPVYGQRDRPAWTHLTGARTLIRKNQKEEKKERDAIKIKFYYLSQTSAQSNSKGELERTGGCGG